MTKLTDSTTDLWHITLNNSPDDEIQIASITFSKGTLANAKAIAEAMRHILANEQEVSISIGSDTRGLVSTLTDGQVWQDVKEPETSQTANRKRGGMLSLILVLVPAVIVIAFMFWTTHTSNVKNMQPKNLSANCAQWELVASSPYFTKSPTEEVVALYEMCQADVQAYVTKHDLPMPKEFQMTVAQKTDQVDLAKATVVLGTCPDDWRQAVDQAIRLNLKDPDSAKIQYGQPHQQERWEDGIRYVYGVVPIHVNAKNSFGAYTGEQQWFAIFESGTVLTRLITQ